MVRLSPALVAVSCARGAPAPVACASLPGSGDWLLEMRSSQTAYQVAGRLRFGGEAARAEVVATTSEGTREPIDAPVTRMETRGDSVFLAFAPVGFDLRGRCLSPSRLEGTFSVPQPPFEPIRGAWELHRP